MKLKKLFEEKEFRVLQGTMEMNISNICYDSRNVIKGSLFVCLTGFNSDGHLFVQQAIKNGASAILCERQIDQNDLGITVILVDDVKGLVDDLSSKFFGYPDNQLNILAVTGTNGKTSIAHMVSCLLSESDSLCGSIGTRGSLINNQDLSLNQSTPTMPNVIDLQNIFHHLVHKNAKNVILEATSIGLDQNRLGKTPISIGIFTNFTQDHLDYHGDMKTYLHAKSLLFDQCETALINHDDSHFQELHGLIKNKPLKRIVTYGLSDQSDFYAKNISSNAHGSTFDLVAFGEVTSVEIESPGIFSIYNAIASAATCLLLGIPLEEISRNIKKINFSFGRFQKIICPNPQAPNVIVDYAHTPDALENVLQTISEFSQGDIWCVFGCGGDRDRTKRPLMGNISETLATHTVLTSDNPRNENPQDIINEIAVGFSSKNNVIEIPDRKQAIQYAISNGKPNDVILIAGKGDETYQIIKDKTVSFDDKGIAEEALNSLKKV